MNWIDWIVVGGLTLAIGLIIWRWIVRRRRTGGSGCAGCPYADSCGDPGNCLKKKPPQK